MEISLLSLPHFGSATDMVDVYLLFSDGIGYEI
jgi:hypothetical protein